MGGNKKSKNTGTGEYFTEKYFTIGVDFQARYPIFARP
jgi:hypothetical protein